MKRLHLLSGLSALLFLAACGGGAPPPAAPPAPEAAAPAAAPPPAAAAAPPAGAEDGEAQAARGAKVYGASCASCHGDAGQGSKGAPPLVGKDALPLDPRPTAKFRKGQFHTALDVAQFVVKNMPPGKAGSIPESDYWDALAFDLKANGVAVAGKHIDATTAAAVKLH
jgi:mono/diheme cytochrome c family protein